MTHWCAFVRKTCDGAESPLYLECPQVVRRMFLKIFVTCLVNSSALLWGKITVCMRYWLLALIESSELGSSAMSWIIDEFFSHQDQTILAVWYTFPASRVECCMVHSYFLSFQLSLCGNESTVCKSVQNIVKLKEFTTIQIPIFSQLAAEVPITWISLSVFRVILHLAFF